MPSDPRVLQALEFLSEPIDRFRSSLAATLEDVRGTLTVSRSGSEGRAEQLRHQFGPFADARFDLARLASVLEDRPAMNHSSVRRLEAAYEALQDISERGLELFCVELPSGNGVGVAVSSQLAAIGRAFGAARVAAAARGVPAAFGMSDEQALTRFPFSEWNTAERRVAPPLVVLMRGCDLGVGTLPRFLDGAMKIVLLVDGPCTPAPLVRLITPNVFVMQAHSIEELSAVRDFPGPAVCALMPPTSARFVHDPRAGAASWQRLTVRQARDGRLARLAGVSAAQQEEEILQLEALAARSASTPIAGAETPDRGSLDPVDRLAAWLLREAHLTEVERT